MKSEDCLFFGALIALIFLLEQRNATLIEQIEEKAPKKGKGRGKGKRKNQNDDTIEFVQ